MSFEKQLKFALKQFHKPDRLSAESALATPFFLSGALARRSGQSWGDVLRQALLASAEALWGAAPPHDRQALEAALPAVRIEPDSLRYSYLVLELRFFKRFFRPRSLQAAYTDFLQTSRSQFYRDIDVAVARLAQQLLRQLRPALATTPPAADTHYVGYAAELAAVEQALQVRRSVVVEGVSGAGKSAFGRRLAQQWPHPVCWFTVRNQINPSANALVTVLAYFTARHGSDQLWKLLLLNAGRIDNWQLVVGLLRADFEQLAVHAPLVCIDEADVWQKTTPTNVSRLREVVAALPCATLLLGQTVALASDERYQLKGLQSADVAALVDAAELSHPDQVIVQLTQRTRGNPRLIWLSLMLLQRGIALPDLLSRDELLRTYLWRLWERLSADEVRLIESLSVFETVAPADAFPHDPLTELSQRHLLELDGHGGVLLHSLIRELVYAQLSADQRESLHEQAGALYALRGVWTLAARHLALANQHTLAVRLWFPHRVEALENGDADAAMIIFDQLIALRSLKKAEREAVMLIRAELSRLRGDLADGLAQIDNHSWRLGSEVGLDARQLRAEFVHALGMSDAALADYGDAVAATRRLLGRLTTLRQREVITHIHRRDLASAERATQLSELTLLHTKGIVAEEQGRYELAEQQYRASLAVATQLDDAAGMARAHRFLSRLVGRRGALASAVEHADAAAVLLDRIGDALEAALLRSNISANYLDAGRYAEVMTVGTGALKFLQRARHSAGIAATASNLAEASYYLGRRDDAEQYVRIALGQEEPLAHPYAYYTQGLILRDRGQLMLAAELLQEAQRIAQRNQDLFIEAYCWQLLGDVQTKAGANGQAALQQALQLFEQLQLADLANDVRQALSALAELS